ncbi:MAG: photosynthetic complex putative assembly protein PuhB [Burkholderiales bacterium]|nr:photosynthetic complex putative assembly protein PuhB [Burkholderiales bacterium]
MIRLSKRQSARIEGIGEDLPSGETVLWQGRPTFGSVFRDVFHWRWVAAWFVVLFAWRVVEALSAGAAAGPAIAGTLSLAPIALVGMALLALVAWLTCRTTIYAITSRRVILRIGIALELTVNIPLKRIQAAAVRTHADGGGDITLDLGGQAHLAYLHLWPHAQPMQWRNPRPMLRALENVNAASTILADALRADAALNGETTGAASVNATAHADQGSMQPATAAL